MANYTDSIGFNKGSAVHRAPSGFSPIIRAEVILDFEQIVAARSAAGATALAASDTLQVIQVPAYTRILHAGVEVLSPETTNTTGTVDLGLTGGDVDGWCDGLAINSAAGTVSVNGVENVASTQTSAATFSADDTLDLLLLTAAPTDVKLRVFAYMLPLQTYAG